jgi:hypothetical protein
VFLRQQKLASEASTVFFAYEEAQQVVESRKTALGKKALISQKNCNVPSLE